MAVFPLTASPELDVCQYLGRCVYQYMCVSIICTHICLHPPLDYFCCWNIFVPKYKNLQGQAGLWEGRMEEKGKLRLNSDLLSGLLMHIVMSSITVSLGAQEPWHAAEIRVPLLHSFYKTFDL